MSSGGESAGRGGPPGGVEAEADLARFTTVRTGGRARFLARPREMETLAGLVAWAASEGLEVAAIGSGSNLLISDAGFDGLVVHLEGELAGIERDGERVLCGGGMRLPSAAAKCAGWGLAGLEFGVNIPGTVGGAVRMNANAYGGELGRVLSWVEICTPIGIETRSPGELDFAYRHSNLEPGEIVARAEFALDPEDPDAVRERMQAMRERRRAAQPSGIKTFGSTFKNPADPAAQGRSAGQLLEAAGCRGLQLGGARFSEKHANFIDNHDGATTADVLAVMAEGRRRVAERFGVLLEPEVQVLGEVDWPVDWGRHGEGGGRPGEDEEPPDEGGEQAREGGAGRMGDS